jgi:putative aldouronate transport system substrate-binding protein
MFFTEPCGLEKYFLEVFMKQTGKRLSTGLLAALVFMTAASVYGGGQKAQPAASGKKLLANGNVTFSAFIAGLGNFVTSYDYKDNTFTKRVTDDTGINFKFTAVSEADQREKLNLLLGSGDYPDLIFDQYNHISQNDMIYYANEGIFIPLDDYDPMSYPNIKAAFDAYPALNQRLRGADGKLYGLPQVNDCLHCVSSGGRGWYYMPFLRDNNRKTPQTLDEFTAYLRWVRDNDVNKNGNKNDEIPLAFAKEDLLCAVAFFAKAFMPFIYTDDYFGLGISGGKVVEQYRDNQFKAALQYLNGLYKEGLIAPNSFSMNRDQLLALAENPDPILAIGMSAWSNNVARKSSGRWVELRHTVPLTGPNGQRWSPNKDPWSILYPGMFITNKCKDPKLALALYDYLLGFDVELDGYIGPKGVAWGDPDKGTKSLMGGDPAYKLLVTYETQPVNGSWDQRNPMIRDSKFRLGEQATGVDEMIRWIETNVPSLKDAANASASFNEIYNYYYAKDQLQWLIPSSNFIPPVALNDADNARVSDINAVLNPYKEQVIVEFITGTRDFNNGWNAYLAELDRMGSKDLVSILQKYVK